MRQIRPGVWVDEPTGGAELERGVQGFIREIMRRTPNGEWIAVQYHPNGDWSVARKPDSLPPYSETDKTEVEKPQEES